MNKSKEKMNANRNFNFLLSLICLDDIYNMNLKGKIKTITEESFSLPYERKTKISLSFNEIGNIIKIESSSGERIFSYDNDEYLIGISDNDSCKRIFSYDNDKCSVNVIDSCTDNYNTFNSVTNLDRQGNIIEMVSTRMIFGKNYGQLLRCDYDKNGNLIELVEIDFISQKPKKTKYEYDEKNRIKQLDISIDGNYKGSIEFRYNILENDKKIHASFSTVRYSCLSGREQNIYGNWNFYDKLGRIVKDDRQKIYSYDKKGNIVSVRDNIDFETRKQNVDRFKYMYDDFGNWLTKEHEQFEDYYPSIWDKRETILFSMNVKNSKRYYKREIEYFDDVENKYNEIFNYPLKYNMNKIIRDIRYHTTL